MKEKKTNSQLLEEIKRNITAKENNIALEKLQVKISIQDITLEERIQEASKPLYLKRYE